MRIYDWTQRSIGRILVAGEVQVKAGDRLRVRLPDGRVQHWQALNSATDKVKAEAVIRTVPGRPKWPGC